MMGCERQGEIGKWEDMMVKKYRAGLSEEEREELKALVSRGRGAAYKQTHARVFLT